MACFDVFNGDADGICALQQLRLAEPREATLVTGVKRGIALLARVRATPGDAVTVLSPWTRIGTRFPGSIPEHSGLAVHIETLPDKGTSLLVDDFLRRGFRAWAVVGTFSDNFEARVRRAARPLGLHATQLVTLRELG